MQMCNSFANFFLTNMRRMYRTIRQIGVPMSFAFHIAFGSTYENQFQNKPGCKLLK